MINRLHRVAFGQLDEVRCRYRHMERASINLVGRDNVVLVRGEGSPRLAILDHGIYRFEVKAVRHPAALKEVRHRLDALAEVARRLGRGTTRRRAAREGS